MAAPESSAQALWAWLLSIALVLGSAMWIAPASDLRDLCVTDCPCDSEPGLGRLDDCGACDEGDAHEDGPAACGSDCYACACAPSPVPTLTVATPLLSGSARELILAFLPPRRFSPIGTPGGVFRPPRSHSLA